MLRRGGDEQPIATIVAPQDESEIRCLRLATARYGRARDAAQGACADSCGRAERTQKAAKAKASAKAATSAGGSKKRKATEAGALPADGSLDPSDPGEGLADDPLDEEGQHAVVSLLTSLAKFVAS